MRTFTEKDLADCARSCAGVLDQKKANDIIVLNLKGVNSAFDYFVIATAQSHLHCRALAKELQRHLHSLGMVQRGKPDLDTGWVLLDFNEIIVHVFIQEQREYYQLEKLWADAERITIDA
ncbi:MAG TPA: ribosome silencing factor [Spirochaetota bacterium]|nr:ribosome silencing factor [Spirochaetota bacterium]HNT10677.1 ribosome silencing factor [Spirochaetota bacterium]HOS41071.1 ribosome silencing factor [Spirochaetota bacterium]